MTITDNAVLIEVLSKTSVTINLYASVIIFVFGVVGNTLNIFVLTQRTLRSVPCIFLFLISSIANLISIIIGLTPRIAATWELDITATYDIPCKLRAFITFSSRAVALWLNTLATIDRYMISSSNHHCRQLSSLKNAQKGSLAIAIISIILYTPMLYCYKANLNYTPLKCYGNSRSCRILTDTTYACYSVLCPLALMTIFGIMTILNIRKSRDYSESLTPTVAKYLSRESTILLNRQKQRWKRLNCYLCRMLALQTILFILLTVPQTIHKIYFTVASNKYSSSLEYDFDRFLYKFELLLPFIESALPFYIYILTGGKIFRKALKKLFLCSK
ncbi:unnamed protein product [Adineta steineri]|uniref:G-protein coupled receptors family 1 profile domain-containing protein n=1 Tax=Adineta steineri TaxID=433720 RepID=A0A815IBV5_9BILA|nr:unnamed protein product [Adineta steineri]